MTFQVMDVARYIVNYCTEQNKPVSNLKLQKCYTTFGLNIIDELMNIFLKTISMLGHLAP